MSFKRVVKQYTPDRIIRWYRESKMFPEYVRAIVKDKGTVYPKLNFYSDIETVDLIVNENKSLSRFGDGEIKWMCHQKLESFQTYSEELAEGLRRAYFSDNSNLLIGIPYGIIDSRKCSWGARMHWRSIRREFFEAIQDLGKLDRTFCNASITRPYIDYNDREYSEECFKNLRRIWEGRNIVFVEGNKTKLGMGNDLFSNAKTIKRILCPAENAFEKIDSIKQSVRKNVEKSSLILAALGPTATILAADLCEEGYQIVDVGHVDVEYIWFIRHDLLRNPIDGKYVNESGQKFQSNLYENDKEYVDLIIDRIE